MPEFLKLLPPEEALELLLKNLPDYTAEGEEVQTVHALGRVLIRSIKAPHSLPEFPRSSVDGYAVHARDTHGSSESMPGYLSLIGEVPMGEAPKFTVPSATCALIHTGGMLPTGADAVVMLENTQQIGLGESEKNKVDIEISRAVAEGENVIKTGEDVKAGQVILEAGKRLQPADIGGCMALGIINLRVATIPRIGIISSGDEVIPPDQTGRSGQVRDVNSYSLAALILEAGGGPILYGIVKDNLQALKTRANKALSECAMLIITAGSSAGARDMTAEAISSLGSPGILVHGVNMRPGKPTILAVCNGKTVIGLPGNPVSALIAARLFVEPSIDKISGNQKKHPTATVRATLAINIPSQAGREDWVVVRLIENAAWSSVGSEARYLAEPIFSKSNLIFSLAAGDGLVRIPPDTTGLSAGEEIEVII